MSTEDAARQGEALALGKVLQRTMERVERHSQWVRAFRCIRTPNEVPCTPGDPPVVPMLTAPLGQVRCPLVETEPCLPGQAWREWTKQEDDRNWRQLAPQLGVQRRYWSAKFETARRTQAVNLCREWVAGDAAMGQCLVILGEPGVGKTYAATCVLRQYPGLSKMFWNMADLASELLHGEDRRAVLKAVRECRFLALDDVGGEYMKAGGMLQAELDGLVVYREAAMLATLMTSRLRPDELRTRLSDSVVDRLNGKWAQIVWVDGISLRDVE